MGGNRSITRAAGAITDRELLTAGMQFKGPAIVEERDSTAVIGVDTTVSVDQFANLSVTFDPRRHAKTRE